MLFRSKKKTADIPFVNSLSRVNRLFAGLRSLDSVSGTGYYRQLMEKLPSGLEDVGDDCVVIDLASWYGPLLAPRLELFKSACAARHPVSFTYCAPSGETVRTVEPGRLLFRWSSWYLWAWCRVRRDWRLFKLGPRGLSCQSNL